MITDKLNHSEKDCFYSWTIAAQQLVLLPYYWYGTRTQARTEGLGMRLLDSVYNKYTSVASNLTYQLP